MLTASREAVASALSYLGYQIQRNWFFKLRDERTASAYINKNGSIKDFGSGWFGDLIDLLKDYHHLNFKEAKEKAHELLGMPIEIDFSQFEKEAKPKKSEFIPKEFIEKFEIERKNNFSRYKELIDKLLPALTPEQRKNIALKYSIGYSKLADRLIMPIKDEKGNIVTLWKYSPFKTPKVKFTKGRERIPFNMADLIEYRKKPDEWVILCEGEKDCLNALGRGYRAVTLGGAGEKLKDKWLPLFKGLKLLIVYDWDQAGKKGAENVASQLEGVAKKVKILDWEAKAYLDGFRSKLCKGFDLTDYFILKG